jgi:hypothetical protein
MVREKRLPTPPPDYPPPATTGTASPGRAKKKHVNQDSSGRRNLSGSSTASTGAKRTAYGSGSANGLRKVDVSDDLSIRLLAQSAMTDVQEAHILPPEEVDELKNVLVWEV